MARDPRMVIPADARGIGMVSVRHVRYSDPSADGWMDRIMRDPANPTGRRQRTKLAVTRNGQTVTVAAPGARYAPSNYLTRRQRFDKVTAGLDEKQRDRLLASIAAAYAAQCRGVTMGYGLAPTLADGSYPWGT